MGIFDGIIIASDFDGTVAVGGSITEENRAAIRYFQENGGRFTLATGRSPGYIEGADIDINAPLIAINGTVIYDRAKDKLIKNYTFPCEMKSVADEILDRVRLQRLSIYSVSETYYPEPEKDDYKDYNLPMNKMVFVFYKEDDAISTRDYLREKYGDKYAFERSWNVGLEMRLKNAGKGKCLEFLKEYTGSKLTVGAGDFENDETLLKSSDISYAPENAIPEIKKIATKVGVNFKEHLIAYIVSDLEQMLRDGKINLN